MTAQKNPPPTTKRPPAPRGVGAGLPPHIADAFIKELKRQRAPMVKALKDTARLDALQKYKGEVTWDPAQNFAVRSTCFHISRPTLRGAIDAVIRAEEKLAREEKVKKAFVESIKEMGEIMKKEVFPTRVTKQKKGAKR